jgi:phage gp46-like protein
MADVRIITQHPYFETIADWQLLPNGFLDETQELANYVRVALMSDRLSDVDEIRPDPDSDDRKGWWADMDAQAIWRGWPIGCRNWLLTRAKITDSPAWEGSTVARAESYTREALQPLIDMRLCTSIDVVAARVDISRIDVAIVIYRGNLPEIELIFQDLWQEMQTEPVLSPYGASI